MPCYANTVALHGFYGEFGADERRGSVGRLPRGWLAHDDDRLADPVAHSLWVDFFEDEATVEEAWREVDARATSRRGSGASRACCTSPGPVPWALKAALLEELARRPAPAPRRLPRARGQRVRPSSASSGRGAAALLERLDLPGRHARPRRRCARASARS